MPTEQTGQLTEKNTKSANEFNDWVYKNYQF